MARRVAVLAALAVLAGAVPAGAGAAGVRLSAGFDRDATLGAPSALRIGLSVDPQRRPSPLKELRIMYPRRLGVVSSGLGLAACSPPAHAFEDVLVVGSGLDGCSPNAVMGYGSLIAEVRLSSGQVIPEYATLALLSGPIEDGRLGLVVYIDGQRPFGGRFVLAGRVHEAPAPYGGALAVTLPTVPALEGVAEVALIDVRLTIGAPQIVYRERVRGRTVAYRPDGVVLPNRCPRGAFRFRARVTFEDGGSAETVTTVPCPAAVRPGSG